MNEETEIDKSAQALLERAADCFDLAKTQHKAAATQHDIASKQIECAEKQHTNADKQEEIGTRQHEGADRLDETANELNALGHALTKDAVEIKGIELEAAWDNRKALRPATRNLE